MQQTLYCRAAVEAGAEAGAEAGTDAGAEVAAETGASARAGAEAGTTGTEIPANIGVEADSKVGGTDCFGRTYLPSWGNSV